MGQAKKRGTFEQRRAEAIVRIQKEEDARAERRERQEQARLNAVAKSGPQKFPAGAFPVRRNPRLSRPGTSLAVAAMMAATLGISR